MAPEIKQNHVELVVLERGNQRQHVRTLRKIPVANYDSRRSAQSRKDPAIAGAPIRKPERKGRWVAHHHAQVERSGIPRRAENLVEKESRNRRNRNEAEQKQ